MNKNNVVYVGIFPDNSLGGCLSHEVSNQHITLSFLPEEEQFNKLVNYIGTKQAFEIMGYGNDGQNEGLLVKLQSPIPYYGAETQHITLSVSEDGSPVNTAFLQFDKPIPPEYGLSVGDVLYGQVAVFADTLDFVFEPTIFEEYQQRIPGQLQNAEEIKQELLRVSAEGNRGRLCPDEINLNTVHFRVNDGEWQALNPDDWSNLQSFVDTPGCKVDMTMQCFDAVVDSSFFPVTLYNVEQAKLIDGNTIIISDGAVFSNIDFVEKEAFYQEQSTYMSQDDDSILFHNDRNAEEEIDWDDGLVL